SLTPVPFIFTIRGYSLNGHYIIFCNLQCRGHSWNYFFPKSFFTSNPRYLIARPKQSFVWILRSFVRLYFPSHRQCSPYNNKIYALLKSKAMTSASVGLSKDKAISLSIPKATPLHSGNPEFKACKKYSSIGFTDKPRALRCTLS
ncbi:hypothetical protein Lisr_0293, partial [Legionella israelensis]